MTPEFDEALIYWEAGDIAAALRLWHLSAERGDNSAQLQIGLCHELGLGTKPDCAIASRFYEASANAGNPEAQFSLATLYRDGRGVPRDFSRAIELFRSSAERGILKSHTALGSMFGTGMGVVRDTAEASRWYRLAAHRGDRDAQVMMGVLYLSGDGVPKDFESAADWFRKAAEVGDVEAQFNLGIMYFQGQGVPRDPITSHKWLNLSKVGGYDRASRLLAVVASELNHDELKCAIAMAQEFSGRARLGSDENRVVEDPQRIARKMGMAGDVEIAVKAALGDSLYSSLHSLTRAYLLKAETEYCNPDGRSVSSAAFFFSRAFETEFNRRIRDALVADLLHLNVYDHPAYGDRKFVRHGQGNQRLTPGQVLHFLKEDSLVQRLLRDRGLDPETVLRACEPVVILRNQVIHDDSTPATAELLRDRLVDSKSSVFRSLMSQNGVESARRS